MTQPYGGDRQYGENEPTARYEVPPGFNEPARNVPDRDVVVPGRRAAVANAYGDPVGSGARFGVVGATLAGIGAVLLVIAFTAVNWRGGAASSTFGDLGNTLDVNGAANGVAHNYFGWLGWLLAVLVVTVAILANLPSAASGPLRALGAVGAAAAIAVTFFAINLYSDHSGYFDYLKDARLGFYFALAGFLLAGIGAMVGPTSRR